MAVITYWSTLFLCFFFINNTQQNRPMLDLNENLREITQNLKRIQAYCKQNKLDLNTLLSKQELKQYQADVAFVKKYSSEIKGDMFVTKENDPNKDISEPAFVDAVLQWREKIIASFKETKKNYAAVNIDTKLFSKDIAAKSSALPLNTALYKEWAVLIAELPNPSKGTEVLDALLKNNKEVWKLTGNVNTLTLHYRNKGNKKVYKQYEATRIDNALPQIDLFLRAIQASTSSDDPNLPENLAAKSQAEKVKLEAEKAKAAEKKELEHLFNVWKKEFVAELGQNDTLHDKNLVSFIKLDKNLNKSLGYTKAYSKPVIDALYIQLKEKAFAAGDSITVKELKSQFVEITMNLDKHIDWTRQLELWKNNKLGFLFPIPTVVHGAIQDAELNVSEERFRRLVRDVIYEKNLSIIDSIAEYKKWEKVNDRREVVFDGAILKNELQIAFSKKIQSIFPLAFVYDNLLANLKDGKISLDNFKIIWETSMQASYKDSKSENSIYHKWIAEETLWKVEQALDSMEAFFPNEAILMATLEEARIVPDKKVRPKLCQYENTKTTNFTCVFEWYLVESMLEVTGKEAANQSSLTKVTEYLKSLGKGVELVIGELEGVAKPLRLNIPNLAFDVHIPMELTQQFDDDGTKFVAAVPNNLDTSYVKFKGDNNYFGVEVLRMESLSELPKFKGMNKYNQENSSFISMQDIKLTIRILDPQVAVSIGAVGGVELSRHPAEHTVDLVFTIYSAYNLKENQVITNVKEVKRMGGDKVIKKVEITKKEKLELKVFK